LLTVQKPFPFARPLAGRVRSVRRPFRPSQDPGPYRLPQDVRDRLAAALAPFRNREAAFALAVFLARYWSMPGKVVGSFHIDRRALADHRDLGLTEARVRGAIGTLEEVGFLDRALTSGSRYKPTEEGLHRKPILFVFGSDYAPALIRANARAQARRGAGSSDRRSITAASTGSRSTGSAAAKKIISPKSKSAASPVVNLGEFGIQKRTPPQEAEASLLQLRERLANLGPVRLSEAVARGFRDRKWPR
jgi:hypothetical protein